MDPSQKEVIDEVYGYIKVYSDGSVERPHLKGGSLPACPEFVNGVATKDVTINLHTGVWARLFLPECVVSSNRKAPIVLHFHPGGLCMGSPSTAIFHAFCSKMATQSKSIWVSVDYRLAPEHRLPAAYDDAYASFMWLHAHSIRHGAPHGHGACFDSLCSDKHGHTGDGHDTCVCVHQHGSLHRDRACLDSLSCDKHVGLGPVVTHSHGHFDAAQYAHFPDPWLHAHADFSRCFLAGESSGGAIVHYLMLRIVQEEWSTIRVRGLLIIHAAFLIEGVFDTSFDPTKERRQGTLRRLCLPEGAEWDHPFVNPLHVHAPTFKDVVLPPCVVAVADKDMLCTPAKHYFDVMKKCGHCVELYVTEGKGHCFYLRDSNSKEAELLLEHLVAFILGNSSA